MSKSKAPAPPAPLVKITRHPLIWARNTIILLALALLLAHVGMMFWYKIYDLVFETYHPITVIWHHVVPDTYIRHIIRDCGEGLLGGFIAQFVVWNAFKKRHQKKATLSRLDRLEISLHVPNINQPGKLTFGQLLFALPIAVIYAIPGFAVGCLVAATVGAHEHAFATLLGTIVAAHHPIVVHVAASKMPFLGQIESWFTVTWPQKLIGLASSFFFGRRPMKKVYDGVQLWFAERRVSKGKPNRMWQTVPYKARCNYLREQAQAA